MAANLAELAARLAAVLREDFPIEGEPSPGGGGPDRASLCLLFARWHAVSRATEVLSSVGLEPDDAPAVARWQALGA